MQAMVKAYVNALRRTFDFAGKSTREDFWWFQLGWWLLYLGVLLIAALLSNEEVAFVIRWPLSVLCLIAVLLVMGGYVSLVSLTIRRLRDAGKSWHWFFILIVPFVGPFWLLVLLCRPSNRSGSGTFVDQI